MLISSACSMKEMVLLLILFLFLTLVLLSFLISKISSNVNNLPPGPPPFPIIGNLFQLGSKPHSTLAQLSQTYGPLFSLKFGSQLVVVASSPGAASEVLKTHDSILSGRYIIYNARSKNYVEHSMVWAPECTEAWKNLRRISRTKLFSPRAIERHARMREGKVEEMMGILRDKEGEMVRLSEVVFGTIFNVLGCLIFSKDVFDVRGDEKVRSLKGHLCRMLELGSAISLADCFPKLGWMTWGRRVSEECRRNVFASWRDIINERRESLISIGAMNNIGHGSNSDDDREDFLSSLIKAGFSNDQINALLLEIFGAAADTTASTIEWAMVEILKNPRVLHKLRSELTERLNREYGNTTTNTNNVHQTTLKEADLPRLPYLQAITKETLRLHPATPLLLPRRALQTCKVMGYTIPKDCQVLVNAWAIGRDSKTWENALEFWPERFLESQVDYRGNGNFELVPFGGGRRICPGVPLASQLIPLIVGSMVWNFDWGLPHGMSPHELSREEKFGLTLQKDPPLVLVPKILKID